MEDGMVTFDTKEEADRFGKLASKIMVAIEETGCTYKEAMQVIDAVKQNYENKARDFLNDQRINEIAWHKALLE